MWASHPVRRSLPHSNGAAKIVNSVAPARSARQGLWVAGGRRGFFFNRQKSRLLNIEGLESPRDFQRLAQDAVQAAKQTLQGAASRPPLELVQSLDDASNGLCRIADAAELCRNVHPNEKYVASANDAVQSISSYMGEVNLDFSLYDGMRRAEASPDYATLPLEARTVLHHMRVSMEHEGIHLPDSEKAECLQLLELEQNLSFNTVQRQEQVRRASPGAASEGVWARVEHVREALGNQVSRMPRRGAGASEEVLLPLDAGLADWVLKMVPCASTRQRMHEAVQAPDAEGDADLASLLGVRQRLARLRGYPTWNGYAQREAILRTPDAVSSFLDSAWQRLKPGVLGDLRRLAEEKERLGLGDARLQPWDVPLLLQRCKRQADEHDAATEYLTYGSLMKGVDLILSRLLGLNFVAEAPGPGEVWHPSVQKFTLRQKDGPVLGILYMDPFARPGKVVQSAQFTLQGSKDLGVEGRQVPITTLVYSLHPGAIGLPHSHAVTFMHEIGHAVHSLLSETSFQHLSGTRGTIDFVEFPSHLFEHFVLDPSCLREYAVHSKTGASMPLEVQESVRRNQVGFAHLEAVQQLMYAAVDQAFYSCVPSAVDGGAAALAEPAAAAAAAAEVQRHLDASLARFDREVEGPFEGSFRELLGLSRPSKFDHLVHYGGSYYCYLFNRALSAHIWREGFREDPFSAETGTRLRGFFRGGSVVQSLDAVLALCPSVKGFRPEDVPMDALIEQLGGSP